MRKTTFLVLIVLFAAACAHAAYPMRVRDARGKEVTIKRKPVHIVSLTPSNTEVLFALGLSSRIVGVTRYCDYPAAAKKVKNKVGDMAISVESVVAAKPDLVIAHAYVNRAALDKLERLGLTVFTIDPKTIREVTRDIRTLGHITARPKTASRVARSLEDAVAAVRTTRAKQKREKVLVVIQSNPLWVAGPRTFVSEMLETANVANVAHDARRGFATFSKELAISRNPDVIIVGMDSDVESFAKSPVWRNTNAARNKRIYAIDSALMVRPGPRLAKGLRQLAAKLEKR